MRSVSGATPTTGNPLEQFFPPSFKSVGSPFRLSDALWIDFCKESLRFPDRPSHGHNEYYSFYCYTC